MVPLSGRQHEFSYCDAREMPPEMKELAAKVGDTVLLVTFFNPIETLALTFTL